MKKVNVAITINITEPTESFFTNGIKQNAIILRDCLLKTDIVNECYYMNFGPQKDLSKSPWKKYEKWVINDFNSAIEKIDLFINVCINMGDLEIEKFKRRNKNGKVINHVMGNEYYSFLEKTLFKQDEISTIYNIKDIDATWLSAHLYETNKDLYEVLYDTKAYIAPYIWSPSFLMGHVESLKNSGMSELYVPSNNAKKRISVFEPNIQMNKTSIFPMIIAEKFYKKYPDEVRNFNIFGTDLIKNKKPFIKFASGLQVYKNKHMFFESRYPIAFSLIKHSDIVLSHQQDLALNYLYFDAAWLGYPVIHNAHFVKELGWYYDRYEAEVAVKHIHEVITIFDTVPGYRQDYLKNSREYIAKFLPDHPSNVKGYNDLIIGLFEKK
jgi:hypothetical protein